LQHWIIKARVAGRSAPVKHIIHDDDEFVHRDVEVAVVVTMSYVTGRIATPDPRAPRIEVRAEVALIQRSVYAACVLINSHLAVAGDISLAACVTTIKATNCGGFANAEVWSLGLGERDWGE
jgi:hypothetical protein